MKSLPLKNHSYLVLAVLWGIFFVGFSVRMAVITTMPLIREELQISYAQAGMLLSLLSFSYGIIQFPSGILTDVYDNKKLLMIVTLFLALALTGVSLSSDLLPLAISLLLTGFFIGFSSPITFSMLSRTFSKKTGTMIGVYESAAPIAQFLGTLVSGIVATEYDWHWVYYVWIVLDLGLAILVWKFFKTTKTEMKKPVMDRKTFDDFFSNKALTHFLAAFVANSVCAFSLLSMAPLYMVEVHGLDVALTATIFGGTRLLGLAGSFIGGYLSDRFSKIRLLLISLSASATLTYAFATMPFGPWVITILSLNAVSTSVFFTTTYTLIAELTSSSIRGKAQGLYNTAAFTISGMSPYIMGVITDLSSFTLAFMFPLLIAVMGIVWILILIKRGYPKKFL